MARRRRGSLGGQGSRSERRPPGLRPQWCACTSRVCAAFFAAAERPAAPLVCAAFFAAAERSAAVRFFAADVVCFDSAAFDAAECPSRFNAFLVARDRVADVLCAAPSWPTSLSCAALRRVPGEAFFGGGRSTPARRAFDKPIAIACFVERAPCLPSRMWSISSWTNSPACVLADLPSR